MVKNAYQTSLKVLDRGGTSNLVTTEVIKHLLMHV